MESQRLTWVPKISSWEEASFWVQELDVSDSMSTNFSKLLPGSNIPDPVSFYICNVEKLLRPARDSAVVDNRSISSFQLSHLLTRIIFNLFITALVIMK